MAISKKGLRSLIVKGQKYYWKFHQKITVFPEDAPNSMLIVDFGYFDVWLFANDKENRPPDFAPQAVTPSFVSESIQFALANDWQENKMEIDYKEGIFTVKSS